MTDYLTELDGDELSWSYRFLSHPSETNNPLWTLVPSNFSYSMNIVAEVEALGETKETSEHRLAAIDQNGQTVGVAQGSSYQDIWIYNLTIYSNEVFQALGVCKTISHCRKLLGAYINAYCWKTTSF